MSILAAFALACSTAPASSLQVTFTDLNPSGADFSECFGVEGSYQVGHALHGGYLHAASWTGTSDGFVDLDPAGNDSTAYALSGSKPVGTADNGGAVVWSGIGQSRTRLSSGSYYAVAYGASGTQYVGQVQVPGSSGSRLHAALWRGTSGSYVDLHPLNASQSVAKAVSATQQAGYAYFADPPGSTNYVARAAMWSGSASSFTDLTPSSASQSVIYGMSTTQQVGSAVIAGTNHAVLWSGTADSFVDLHPAGRDLLGAEN